MQPTSSFVPTQRRQPSLIRVFDGSQHCAAIVMPCASVACGSVMQVVVGWVPRPPSSACTGVKRVGAPVGAAVVGDALGSAMGDAVGAAVLPGSVGDAVGEVVGDTLSDVLGVVLGDALGDVEGDAAGDALGGIVHGRFVHTICEL